MENRLLVEVDEEYSPMARLIELGRQKKYVTIDDILHFFPEAEKDIELLEEAFSALLSAGVAFVEDAPAREATENELVTVEETEAGPGPERELDDYLSNIDSTDSIGLYLKEVS
jgi:RNA polymerase primary sigma factor